LNDRKKIIGGSEISVITGHSKFSSLAGLIAEKTGLS
jgi:predicted phage-related endonuclease